MSLDLNWENILETLPETAPVREPLPPGSYNVRVEDAESGTSKTGNNKIEMTFVVEDGPHKGRRIWGRINFATGSPDSMAITVEQLAQFGITRKWLATNTPTTEQIARKLIGETVEVRTAQREYNGKVYADIKGYKALARDEIPF
jgi:hypothetical protein